MKSTVFLLIVFVVCLFFYLRQHPFGRPAIPSGHEYTPEGVYFLRAPYTIQEPAGAVQWKPGQQVFADRLAKTSAPAGERLVTDGTHSASIPANLLSEDLQEGRTLRQAAADAQAQLDAQAKAREQANAQALAQVQAQAQLQAQAAAKAEGERQRAEAEARARQDQSLAAQARPAAATTPRKHSLNLEAQSVANGGASNVQSGTAASTSPYGTGVNVNTVVDRRISSSSTHVQVTVHNFSQTPDAVKVEWYFVGVAVGGSVMQFGSKEFVFDQTSQDLTIPAGGTETRVASSKEVQAVSTRSTTTIGSADGGGYYLNPQRSQRGLLVNGWFVRMIADGKVIDSRGSSAKYEDVAKDDAKLKAMTRTTVR